MHRYRTIALTTLLTLASVAHSKAPTDELHWLQGNWCLEADQGTRTEEIWLPTAGDMLFGVSRSWRAGKVRSFEFLRIAVVDGTLTYLAQPGGRPPTAFKRVDGGQHWVRFQNLAHDFPQQIEYRRSEEAGRSALRAQISGPDGKGGQQKIAFDFRACED